MGSFSNLTTKTTSSYDNTISNLTQGYQDRLVNSFYRFTDKKPTPVDYWNTNTELSTLDLGTRQNYDQLTEEDPTRYNRVKGFYLYGITRMSVDLQLGEFGPETSPIEGEAYVLPNTIIPVANDYFMITYLRDNPILFRITAATQDTLENGSNFYKVSYELNQVSKERYDWLMNHTVKTFTFYPENVGTNLACIFSDEESATLSALQSLYDNLRRYYIEIFYRANIQTFVFPYAHGDYLIYDPYLIEFIIRNKLLTGFGSEYMYISQATFRSSTFALEYTKTLFKDVEDRNNELVLNSAYPIQICDPNSLLIDRLEEYLELSVLRQNKEIHSPINILDMDLFDRIVNNNRYDEEDIHAPVYRNIIIDWVNRKEDMNITKTEIDSLERIEFARDKLCYYEIPLILFCLKGYLDKLQSKPSYGDKGTICPECYMTRK